MKIRKIVTFLIIFFLILFSNARAQQLTFSGAIVMANNEILNYRIVYQLNGHNVLSGYSLSDINGDNETKASIVGTYNPKSKVLCFEEKEILFTKANLSSNEFCLMKVNGKLERKAKNIAFSGVFTSSSQNPEVNCESGTILLFSQKTLDKLKRETTNILEKALSQDSLNNDTKYITPIPITTYAITEVGAGSKLSFELSVDEFQIDIVDYKFDDGDKITLLRNNATFANGIKITNQVKSFRFKLTEKEKEVTFKIVSESEGSIALTTISVILKYNHELHPMIVSLKKGESAIMILRRK